MSDDIDRIARLAELLEENYYAIITTGAEAVETARDDLARLHFNNGTNEEWGTTDDDIKSAIDYLEIKMHVEGKLNMPAILWYANNEK
jgi:hypothetical protein